MNWIVVSVLGLVLVFIPTSLAIALCVFRDTHEYDAHYNENGYSQIAQKPQEELESNEASSSKENPVSEWPGEL